MIIKCIVSTQTITAEAFYKVYDKDNIGYKIQNNLGEILWYSDMYFELPTITRDNKIKILLDDTI